MTAVSSTAYLCAISVLQFICGGGGCLVILLCHSESVSLHDCGCTQATGQKTAGYNSWKRS